MDGEELTEQETALYDRQIRVWGVDAQRRLSKSHILVNGMKGAVVEDDAIDSEWSIGIRVAESDTCRKCQFCKNIILAGVGSLTIMDDHLVTEEALSANFLIPPDENMYSGKSLAELCCDSLRDFNPMVRVSVEKGDLSSFDGDFYDKFDVVVVSCCSLTTKKLINEKCRKRQKRIAFFTVDCRDSCGEIFVDLQNYTYAQKKRDDTIECQLRYPSFKQAVELPWWTLPKKVTKLYLAMRVIERFEQAEGRNLGEISTADLPSVLRKRNELCKAEKVDESKIPDGLLERLLAGTKEHPPVCAIIGGILGQEVIKVISGKGDPLKNFFFFDAMDGKGIIEDMDGETLIENISI